MSVKPDPTQAIRNAAISFPLVDEGTACTQSSFKVDGKAFLFVGMQGGRYKAMFKLDKSKAAAERLAAKEPDNYQVGNTAWVTARFTAEKPLPATRWKKWLAESYHLSCPSASPTKKKAVKKKAVKKKAVKKKAVKKKADAGKKSAKKKKP